MRGHFILSDPYTDGEGSVLKHDQMHYEKAGVWSASIPHSSFPFQRVPVCCRTDPSRTDALGMTGFEVGSLR